MSARAAWRLESLGFPFVFRYTLGKADWAASGLLLEGSQAAVPGAGTLARRDVPTCRLTERLGEVRERLRAAAVSGCVVINDVGVVLGWLSPTALGADFQTAVETTMETGPTTVRPNTPLPTVLKRMREQQLDTLLVTTSDGQLVGMLVRAEVEQQEDAGKI